MGGVVPAIDVPEILSDLPNFEAHSETFEDGTHYVQALINDTYFVGYGLSDAAAFADMLANNEGIQAAIDATRANGQHDAEWFYEQQFIGGEFGGGVVYDPPDMLVYTFTPLPTSGPLLADHDYLGVLP